MEPLVGGRGTDTTWQEWNLLSTEDKQSYVRAKEVLQERLDAGNKTLAAHDCRHTCQQDGDSVTKFIRRLERIFQLAFGRDRMEQVT